MSIVDELVVEFGLDPTKFTKGQRELLDELDKTKEKVRKDGGEIERSAKNMADGFQTVVRAVGLLTAGYATASTMSGFAQQTHANNVAVHQLGVTLGLTAEKLAQYRQAARAAGVSPEGMTQSIVGATQALNNVATGQAGGNFWTSYARLGVKGPLLDPSGRPIPVEDYLKRVQQAVHETQRSGRYNAGQITSFLSDLGINQETAYVLQETTGSLDKFIEETRKLKTITNDSAAEAQRLKQSYGELTNQVEELANAVVQDLNPGLASTLKWLKEIVAWFSENRRVFEIIAGVIAGATAGAAVGTVIPGVGTAVGAVAGGIAGGITGGTLPQRGASGSVPSPGAAPSTPSPGAGAVGPQGSIDRSVYAEELKAKPWLKEKILGIAAGENMHPMGNVAVMETMMNRAAMTNKTLEETARLHAQSGYNEGGYYAGYNPGAARNPRTRAMLEANLQKVLDGSNVSNYATDNASSWLAAKHLRTGDFEARSGRGTSLDYLGGETYFAPGRRRLGGGRDRDSYERWLNGATSGGSFNDRFGNWPERQGPAAWPTPWLNNRSPFIAPGNVTNDNRKSSSISIGKIDVATTAQNAEDLATGLDRVLASRLKTVQATSGLV